MHGGLGLWLGSFNRHASGTCYGSNPVVLCGARDRVRRVPALSSLRRTLVQEMDTYMEAQGSEPKAKRSPEGVGENTQRPKRWASTLERGWHVLLYSFRANVYEKRKYSTGPWNRKDFFSARVSELDEKR